MRLTSCSLIVGIALSLATSALGSGEHVTGNDWLLMNHEEKVTYIFTAIQVLESQSVLFAGSPHEYIQAIDDKLTDAPDLVTADVANILVSIVYEAEPNSRQAIDNVS